MFILHIHYIFTRVDGVLFAVDSVRRRRRRRSILPRRKRNTQSLKTVLLIMKMRYISYMMFLYMGVHVCYFHVHVQCIMRLYMYIRRS